MIFDRILFEVFNFVVVLWLFFSLFSLWICCCKVENVDCYFWHRVAKWIFGCDFSSRDLRPFAMIYELRMRQGNSCNLRKTRFGVQCECRIATVEPSVDKHKSTIKNVLTLFDINYWNSAKITMEISTSNISTMIRRKEQYYAFDIVIIGHAVYFSLIKRLKNLNQGIKGKILAEAIRERTQ